MLIAKAAETGHVTSAELTPLEEAYRPQRAIPTERLDLLMAFRSVNPIYGMFLVELLGHASFEERIQAFESVLEIPRSAAKYVRVPRPDILPFGPLALEYVHPQLLSRGLATAAELGAASEEDEGDWWDEDDRPRVLTFAEKLRLLFQSEFPDVHDVFVQPCWAVGELIRFGGDFHKLVSARQAVKQEGVLFRHLLRFVLLLEEFGQLTPPDMDAEVWRAELRDLATQVTASCRDVDSQSTDQMLEEAHAAAAVIDALR